MPNATKPCFSARSFQFFEDLARENTTHWFDENRDIYDEAVDAPFQHVLSDLSERLSDAEVPLRGSEETCFRINRDVRFTHDKTPYNLCRSALLTPSGRRSEAGALFYLQFASAGGMTFCGFHALDATTLAPMRRQVLDAPEDFDEVLERLDAAGCALETDDALAAMPRGFEACADHRHADILRLRTLGVRRPLPKVAWTSGDVVDRCETMAREVMPLLAFFR
ncbi:TIGR02453 family protein [Jannaschia marina]|uniref:TIGR02453 family protein n=1 Tax=Jannaschia marina TaxID=2741674 RepID=UPI0015CC590C|nr:DUF2461 domain-containing protein [Jannaschia marina]